MVTTSPPRLVIPSDDMAFRLLSWVVTERHAGMRPDLQLQLSALVRASLGDPVYYEGTVDKTRLPPLAEALVSGCPLTLSSLTSRLPRPSSPGTPIPSC